MAAFPGPIYTNEKPAWRTLCSRARGVAVHRGEGGRELQRERGQLLVAHLAHRADRLAEDEGGQP